MLDAISPLDGRYASATAPLREFFSEFALIRARAHIELRYLLEFDSTGVFPRLTAEERMRIEALEISFAADDADKVKAAEKITRHDVKALEFFLRDHLGRWGPLFAGRLRQATSLHLYRFLSGLLPHWLSLDDELLRATMAEMKVGAECW